MSAFKGVSFWARACPILPFLWCGLIAEGSLCGPSEGSCAEGFCCSESGFCGNTADYCSGPQCQLDYSHTCDTLRIPAGKDTSMIPRPKIGDVPYTDSMIISCARPGMLAITYDDGPYIYTEALLNLLHSVEVQATFFVTGSNLGKGQIDDPSTPWPGILRRMHDAGHQVGSHTWTHRDLNQANATIRRAEIIHNEMALRNIFDWIPTYFRPPYLECDVASGCGRMISDFSYHSVSTNLDTKDYMFDQPELIQQSKDRFLDGLPEDPSKGSYIVLAHDTHEQTVVNLTSFMVQVARQRGYRLVTIGECLGDPRQNWYRIVDNLE